MKTLASLIFVLPLLVSAQEPAPEPTPAPPPEPVAHQVLTQPDGTPGAGMPGPVSGPRRSPWYIGFGIGTAVGAADFENGGRHSFTAVNYPHDRATVALEFHAGATVTPRLLIGGELGAIVTSGSYQGYDSSFGVGYLDAVATWFPVGSFFLRGGVGRASARQRVEVPGDTLEESVTGLDLLGGVGYAWRPAGGLTLLWQVDARKAWFDDKGLDSTETLALRVGFDWD